LPKETSKPDSLSRHVHELLAARHKPWIGNDLIVIARRLLMSMAAALPLCANGNKELHFRHTRISEG
jgi:hypothetical protein